MRHLVQLATFAIGALFSMPAIAGTPEREYSAEAVVADAALRAMRDADAAWRSIAEHAAEHRAGAAGWPCDESRSNPVIRAMREAAQSMAADAAPIRNGPDCSDCVECEDCPGGRPRAGACVDCPEQTVS